MFKRKAKGPTLDDLVGQYRAHLSQRDELQERLSAVRRRALEASQEPSEEDLLRLERAIAMAEEGMDLTRERLTELVRTERSRRLSEYDRLKFELESELLDEARKVGERLGEALGILMTLGLPIARMYRENLMEAIEETHKRYQTSSPGLNTQVRDSVQNGIEGAQNAVQARNFEAELAEIAPADNASLPGEPGFEKSVKLFVARLLEPGRTYFSARDL